MILARVKVFDEFEFRFKHHNRVEREAHVDLAASERVGVIHKLALETQVRVRMVA